MPMVVRDASRSRHVAFRAYDSDPVDEEFAARRHRDDRAASGQPKQAAQRKIGEG
jgi:hypothetical protein